MIQRAAQNPLITKDDLISSIPGFHIIGVFNPGAVRFNEEILLLARVAEAPLREHGLLKAPVMCFDGDPQRLEIKTWQKDSNHIIDDSDPRKFRIDGKCYLTSISHLRLMRSSDGIRFTIAPEPFMIADRPDEAYGVEDARITQIDDTFFITYTAISGSGYGVALASTKDFIHVKRHGMILPPQNKDACLFPRKINGKYYILHRPLTEPFSKPSIWIAESEDLLHWGNNRPLLHTLENRWEKQKIGAGPQPIETQQGWLVLYHGCGEKDVYSHHLCLLDLDNPAKVIKRTTKPFMTPQMDCERSGFFPNVVFCNGWVKTENERILIYYGAADEHICLVETKIGDLLNFFSHS